MRKMNHSMNNKPDSQSEKKEGIPDLLHELELLERKMLEVVQSHRNLIGQLNPEQQSSCINLLFYLALRSEDIRDLQNRLHIFGLSSLASSESHVYSQMNAILERLGKIILPDEKLFYTYENAVNDIRRKGELLFGLKKEVTVPYLMVTLDSDYAKKYDWIKELLLKGMNVARINCAHDDEGVWAEMVEAIRKASAETGLNCKIYMDLAGPKIRTVYHGKKGKHKLVVEVAERIYLSENDQRSNEKTLGCTIKGIIPQLKAGERVLFDDGSVECTIEKIGGGLAELRVTRISRGKPFIKSEKGINFPDSSLSLSSLTDFDLRCLPFIDQHADLIGYSFVRTAKDLEKLQHLLKSRSDKTLFIILKIETQEAVKNLPSLLIQGMREKAFGVMIARGDLAIEVGFERLSEIQEEILWICEAAHVPVIWATQVLDSLNKSGLATRSEITDAAYSGRAECVMINKGKHTIEVMETLKDILLRGGGHHIKKRYTFRPLNIAKSYLSSIAESTR
jgi:pyruvate kinase